MGRSRCWVLKVILFCRVFFAFIYCSYRTNSVVLDKHIPNYLKNVTYIHPLCCSSLFEPVSPFPIPISTFWSWRQGEHIRIWALKERGLEFNFWSDFLWDLRNSAWGCYGDISLPCNFQERHCKTVVPVMDQGTSVISELHVKQDQSSLVSSLLPDWGKSEEISREEEV